MRAGVAFKLAWALAQHAAGGGKVDDRMRKLLLQLLGLAAIGTVADVVPLIDENRILSAQRAEKLLSADPLPGMKKLFELAKLTGKTSLGSEDIAFAIAPRVERSGTFGSAQLGVELLTTQDEERAAALWRLHRTIEWYARIDRAAALPWLQRSRPKNCTRCKMIRRSSWPVRAGIPV
ncbi:MAG: hypothetical protein U0892_06190 [Pirellulales bacterium]